MTHRTSRFIVAQLGARRHYAVARGLHAVDGLALLVTDACGVAAPFRHFRWCHVRGLSIPGMRSILSRVPQGVPSDLIVAMPGYFTLNTIREKFISRRLSQPKIWAERNRRFGNAVSRLRWPEAEAIYAYNGAALEVFQNAKRRGLRCILDQTAAPWRFNTHLLEAESQKWPGWEESPSDMDVSHIMAEREEAEWELADRIICGSDFVRQEIKETGGPSEKVRVVPYPWTHGVLDSSSIVVEAAYSNVRPLRLLFAGTLQLRKGIQYFYELASRWNGRPTDWRAVGPSHLSSMAMQTLRQKVEWIGRVSRDQMSSIYAWADAVVFPTLSEGSANVCLEALALGKTVISTTACGLDSADHASLKLMDRTDMLDFLKDFRPEDGHQVRLADRSVGDYGRDLLKAIDGK